MNVLELFAGIGGMSLGLERAGMVVVGACEIDEAACGVYADHWSDVPLFPDVTELTADDLGTTGVDLVTAGWPCQGNSAAGLRGGMDDPRSGLWREVVRLLAQTRARWFVGENVPGLLSINDGHDFRTVVHDLDELGYGVAWRVLDAQYFGVPQRRRRVFIVGCLGDGAAPVEVLLEPESRGGDSAASRQAGQGVAATLTSGSHSSRQPGRRGEDDVNLVATTLLARQAKGPDADAIDNLIAFDAAPITHPENRSNPQPGDPAMALAATGQPMVTHALTSEGHDASEDGTGRGTPLVPVGVGLHGETSHGGDISATVTGSHGQPPGVIAATEASVAVRRLTPRECERLQGFPDGWTATSWDKPQSDSARYRQLGNAVAVPVVEWIARGLIAADRGAVT